MPSKTRTAKAKSAPPRKEATAPVWVADVDDLYSIEQDILITELGAKSISDIADLLNSRPAATLALAAVLIARRDDRSIPVDRYKTLRLRDLTVPDAVEEAGPTSPA